MNKQSTDTDGIRRLNNALCGVMKQRTAKTLAMERSDDGQTSQHHNGNRLRHIAAEAARGNACANGTGCQGIISNNMNVLANNKRARSAADLIRQRAAF